MTNRSIAQSFPLACPPSPQKHAAQTTRPSLCTANTLRQQRRHLRAAVQIVARIAARIVARNAMPEISVHPYRNLSIYCHALQFYIRRFAERFGQHFGQDFGHTQPKFRAKFRAHSDKISGKISGALGQNFGLDFGQDIGQDFGQDFVQLFRQDFGGNLLQDFSPKKPSVNIENSQNLQTYARATLSRT